MSAPSARWGLAIVGSALGNAGLALLVLLAVAPGHEPMAERPDARIRIESHPVEQRDVQAAEARGGAAGETEAGGDSVSQASIPTSRSRALPPSSVELAAAGGAGAMTGPAEAPREPLVAASAAVEPVVEGSPAGGRLRAESLPEAAVGARSPNAVRAGTPPVPSAHLPSREPSAEEAAAVAGRAERAPDLPATGPVIALSEARLEPLTAGEPRAPAATAVPPVAEGIPSRAPEGDRARPEPPRGAEVAAVGLPRSERVGPSEATGAALASRVGRGDEVPHAAGGADRLVPAFARPGAGIPPIAPPAEPILATLAWTGRAEAQVDAASLSAIQSFMREADIAGNAGAGVRDALSALLASVPCARLQTVFVPESGALELHGHIPEEALRDPVLTALRGQVGGAIPVADSMLILPRPQCGTLAALAATSLPQSSDESTNPHIVGSDAYARLYDFSEGERLVFELTGPDYPSHVYADYYDAEGMVIHLEPNAAARPRRLDAAEVVRIGADEGGMELRVAPPFGQEIVVAMATSSPLYDTVRPIREPALPYLEFLRERVAAARARDPGFKGEWVYFFVRTRESD